MPDRHHYVIRKVMYESIQLFRSLFTINKRISVNYQNNYLHFKLIYRDNYL